MLSTAQNGAQMSLLPMSQLLVLIDEVSVFQGTGSKKGISSAQEKQSTQMGTDQTERPLPVTGRQLELTSKSYLQGATK